MLHRLYQIRLRTVFLLTFLVAVVIFVVQHATIYLSLGPVFVAANNSPPPPLSPPPIPGTAAWLQSQQSTAVPVVVPTVRAGQSISLVVFWNQRMLIDWHYTTPGLPAADPPPWAVALLNEPYLYLLNLLLGE